WLADRLAGWQSTGTEVTLDMSDDNMVLQGDAVALGRLLDNLIGNALHHGKPPVDIRLRRAGAHAVLEVAEHGPAISPERRAEALRPLARPDDARTPTRHAPPALPL